MIKTLIISYVLILMILVLCSCASVYTDSKGEVYTLKRGLLVGEVDVVVDDKLEKKKVTMNSRGWWSRLPGFSFMGS